MFWRNSSHLLQKINTNLPLKKLERSLAFVIFYGKLFRNYCIEVRPNFVLYIGCSIRHN